MIHQFTYPEAIALLAFDVYLYFLIGLFVRYLLYSKRCHVVESGDWQPVIYKHSPASGLKGALCLMAFWIGCFCWQMQMQPAMWVCFAISAWLFFLTAKSSFTAISPTVNELKIKASAWKPGTTISVSCNMPRLENVNAVSFYMYCYFLGNECNREFCVKEMKYIREGAIVFDFIWPKEQTTADWILKIAYFKSSGPAHLEYFEIPSKSGGIPDFLRPNAWRSCAFK